MRKAVVYMAIIAGINMVQAGEPASDVFITIDSSSVIGKIKDMHAVNNGPYVQPVGGDQKRGNFEEFAAARIPYARTHDSIACVCGGNHTCDINAIFPDFDADENDPKSYDFVFTDYYLDAMVRAGTKVFYRLGQTIEHGPKKYGALPPKDNAKWARICEHIIRHYNEGWGWASDNEYTTKNIAFSNQFNIVYWEIWNEPDLDASFTERPRNPRNWGGTAQEFFALYETASKHLKECFPDIKIGGPACCGGEDWRRAFLEHCRDNKCPLDFFSWHCYCDDLSVMDSNTRFNRKLLDEYGFNKTESILNEWNYVKGWFDDWVYTLDTEAGRGNQKAAAFIATGMLSGQNAPLDLLMFYDASTTCIMNSLFEMVSLYPMKGYYPFYAWSKFKDYGDQVALELKEEYGERETSAQFRAAAAKNDKGEVAIFIARYSKNDNVSDKANVNFTMKGIGKMNGRVHITDLIHTYTEVPYTILNDDTIFLRMLPNSFALIELER